MYTALITKIQRFLWILVFVLGDGGSSISFAQEPVMSHVQNSSFGNKERFISQDELVDRGKALRQAIEVKYREIEAPGGPFSDLPMGWETEALRKVDATDVVLIYLPIDISIADAKTLLEAAGFMVSPLELNDTKNNISPEKNAGIYGRLQLLANPRWFTSFGIIAKSNLPDGQKIVMVSAAFRKQRN